MVKVGIVGGSGYVGRELLRLLYIHPEAEVTYVTSRRFKGRPIHSVHFSLRGYYSGIIFSSYSLDKLASLSDVVFLALPHGESLRHVPELLDVGLKVIDLSADFRLKRSEDYERWYGFTHPYPDLLRKAVYGLPELHRKELKGADLIASPGCNATAAILASIPLVSRFGLANNSLIIDVKVGSSEAGYTPTVGSHHPNREGSIRPYSMRGHRHSAEVSQELGRVVGKDLNVSLTPHAISSIRGVLATVYMFSGEPLDYRNILRAYVEYFKNQAFVRMINPALPPGFPDPKHVLGSNIAEVSVVYEEAAGIIKSFAAIDNLVRGAAGQAVQAMNICLGFDEGAGLNYPPLSPA